MSDTVMSGTATMSILDTIPTEIMLSIIEEMNLRTIITFMLTCKGYAQLIRTHKRSICTNRSRGYPVPPSGMIFTSDILERGIAKLGEFPILAELELRESRIEFLVQHFPHFGNLAAVAGIGPMTSAQRARLAPLIRRALWQCDAISDIAARVPIIPEKDTSCMSERELWAYQAHCDDMDRVACDDPHRFVNARATQLAYVRGLATEDLAALLLLVTALGSGYMRLRNREWATTRGRGRERALIFEEITLRHGSWFLWAEICGSASMRAHARRMIHAGCEELGEFEAGSPLAPPGVKMTLMELLRKRFQAGAGAAAPPRGNKVIVKAFNLIKRIIGMKPEEDDDEKKESENEETEAKETETPAPAENADAAGQAGMILTQAPAGAA
ncbi:hypothetical protein F4809DRAFT_659081 [Biscogniauxia mediterranea]|nr:hypothetical protein F4809DRAFT_659081 [Biscogniauxia mediterranea]